jgi:GNAT superfamily N-acetyltransferase
MSVTNAQRFNTSSGRLSVTRVDTSDHLATFVAIFRDAYGPADHGAEVGYAGLPEEYPQTLLHCSPKPPVTIAHFVGKSGSEPVAIASIHMAPPVAGLYNVGIRHKFRRQGLGTEVSGVALNFALEKGCKTIFLQTQPDSPVERLYSKVGFSRAFVGKIVSISS